MTPPRFGPQLDFFWGGAAVSSALAPMTREEIVRGLVAAGVPRAKAEATAEAQLGWQRAPSVFRPATPPISREDLAPDPAPFIVWPLQLTLPWSYLESDDDKYGAVIVNSGKGKLIPKLILQARYRDAKTKIRKLARDHVAGAAPVAIPLRLEARVWLPDTSRKRDVPNFAKCVHDALQEAIYTDDTWLYDVRWIRAGVDVDRPRAEITITPL